MKNYYRSAAFISEDALRNNARLIKGCVPEGVRLLGVIKANAYGHGSVFAAKVLKSEGFGYFAVATVGEAVELRKGGVEEPILILGYTDSAEFDLLLKYNIFPAIFNEDDAKALSALAAVQGKKAGIHIKLETGMGRIGFAADNDALEAVKRIAKLPGISIEGMFTHFARADELTDERIFRQYGILVDFANALEKEGVNIPIIHGANSAGIIKFKDLEALFEKIDSSKIMVRAGIILYGYYPSGEVEERYPEIHGMKLKPVMTVKSHIVHLKWVEKGTEIGYGGTYAAPERRLVATVPIGYADGYPRAMSNKGCVLVRGQKAPIIGRVCMDQLMLDVTDIPGVERFDEAILMNEELSAEYFAKICSTISYEILCDFSERVSRIYI